MTQWIDLENDPAPQWVGDMAMRESGFNGPYDPKFYWKRGSHFHALYFHALCRRIYHTETPPVDPDFERMRGVASVILYNLGYDAMALKMESGQYDDVVQVALDKWNKTVAS